MLRKLMAIYKNKISRLARYRPAPEALETYLRGRPAAADRDRIATHAGELRALISQLN